MIDPSRALPALRPLLTGSDRRPVRDLAAARASRRRLACDRGGRPAVQRRVTDLAVAGIRVRLYEPPRRSSRGMLVVVHGGGWVWGGIDEIDPLASSLAVATGRLTATVAYRLAPEHRYPAALDDVTAAVGWLMDSARQYEADPQSVVLVGLSAGGTLATAASARCRDIGRPVVGQVLCYPMLDPELSTPSAREFADAGPLTRGRAAWFWDQYVPAAARRDPGAVPALDRNLADLPPTHVVLAELDVLRDEGIDYARRLRAAGGHADLVVWPGTVHGFLTMSALVPDVCTAAVREIADWIDAVAASSER